MKWLRRREASIALNIPYRRVRTLGDNGTIPTKFEGSIKYYGVPGETNIEEKTSSDFFEKTSDKYIFDKESDDYLFVEYNKL